MCLEREESLAGSIREGARNVDGFEEAVRGGRVLLRGIGHEPRLDAGSMYDGDLQGLSALATEVLARPVLGEEALHPALNWTLHQDPTAFANLRWIEFSASCLPEDFPALLGALAGRLARAAETDRFLPEVQLDGLRGEATRRVAGSRYSTEMALWQRGLSQSYSADSPLAAPPWGEPASLARGRFPDLLKFLERRVVPPRTTLAVAGAIEIPKCVALLRDTLGRVGVGGPGGGRPRVSKPRGPRAWTKLPCHGPRA